MSKLSTKLSIGSTLLVLALGVGLGSHQRSQIAELQKQADTGTSLIDDRNPARRRTISTANETTSDTIAKLVELEPYGKENPDIDRRELDAHFKIQIAGLSSSQSEEIARSILMSESELSKSEVRLFRYCLLALADEHPQTTLDLIKTALENPAFQDPYQFRTATTAALTNLGSVNLTAVNEWLESGSEAFRIDPNKIMRAIFQKRAPRNYGEALSLIESDVQGSMGQTWAMYGLHDSLTLERADEFLTSLRDSKISPHLKREALEALGTKSLGTDVKTITNWIAKNNFDYEEIRGVLGGLRRRGSGSQVEWINWISDDSISRNRFNGAYQSAVRNLLSSLVREDLVKTGQLINSLPDGSKIQEFAKTQYATHISSVNLEVAIEWFDTLPASAKKTKTGRDLYHKFFQKSPTLAEEFAVKNDLYVD